MNVTMERIIRLNNESAKLVQTGLHVEAMQSLSLALRNVGHVIQSREDDNASAPQDEHRPPQDQDTTSRRSNHSVETVLQVVESEHTNSATSVSPDNVFRMCNLAFCFASPGGGEEADGNHPIVSVLSQNCDLVTAVILYNYAFAHHCRALSGLDARFTKSFQKAMKLYCMALQTLESARSCSVLHQDEGTDQSILQLFVPTLFKSAILINLIQIHSHFWQQDAVKMYRQHLQGIFAEISKPQTRRNRQMSNDEYNILREYVNFDMHSVDAFKLSPAA
jgi:hypothetical protein